MILNVHDLNNEGSVGQALDIRQIKMVGEDGSELDEMPAVSGRMMKHWHLAHIQRAELERGEDAKLCDDCRIMEPQREPESEMSGLRDCIVCDVHGFLKAEKVQGEDGKKVIPRRSSCAMFSWLLPVVCTQPVVKQVIHNRVTSPDSQKESMMPFHKSYASGVYALVCSLDLVRIGKPLATESAVGQQEATRRGKMAVQALLPICTGAFGASQSHALPHTRCTGLLAALSTTEKPLPNLVSPIYSRVFEESVRLLESLKGDACFFGYAPDDDALSSALGDHARGTVQEVFDEVLSKI